MEECRKSLLPPVVWNFLKLHKHGQASQLQKSGSCHVLGALGPRRIWAWYGSKFSKRLASKHVNPRIMTTSFVGQLAPLLRPIPGPRFLQTHLSMSGCKCFLFTLYTALALYRENKGPPPAPAQRNSNLFTTAQVSSIGFAISLLQ